MTIYIDVVLIENLCMNYIILFATGYILKTKRNPIRLIISSLIGGIYSIIAYMQIVDLYSNMGMKFLLSVIMIYIAYNAKNIKTLAKQIVMFYLVSFVFGGCAFALLYFIKPQEIIMQNGMYVGTYPLKIALLGGLVGFIITAIAFKVVKAKLRKKDMFCEIEIYLNEKSIRTKAMIDTGNLLKDPITRMPVIVVQKNILYDIIPYKILDNLENIIGGDVSKELYEDGNIEYISKFRVIPFSSIGKQNGLLLGFKASKVETYFDETKKQIQNVVVGIYNQSLSKKEEYCALIGLDLLREE